MDLRTLTRTLVIVALAITGGCATEAYDLRVKNEAQRQRIQQLEAELSATKLELEQARKQLDSYGKQDTAEVQALKAKVAVLEADLDSKKALISTLQDRLVHGGAALPVELTAKLDELSKKYPIINYDPTAGSLKISSDVLFEKGSDVVASQTVEALKSLCEVLNSPVAQKFDIVVAGHTDDIPIERPDTKQKHPTNWHLSAHRAIAVLNVLAANNVSPNRLSIRGFGEYRPAAPNAPGKKGNPQNRRVEIYLVPQGA
ncbi:MAG: OmpA family protein [Sedimentisphaerales bacterium]|jgi:chemotaxis protein MotB|nr:OmpA family protein [Sedimentisphaerales bacterium]